MLSTKPKTGKIFLLTTKLCLCMSFLLVYSSCEAPKRLVSSKKIESDASTYSWVIRERILSQSLQQIGIPYKRAGKSPEGFDCSGLMYYLFNKNGISLGPSSVDQFDEGYEVNISDAQAGDLLFFGYKKKITHVAMILHNKQQELSIIHSTSSRGVITENVLKSDYWMRRIIAARSFDSYFQNQKLAGN